MALPVRKGYSGSGVSTTLTSSPTNSDTTFTVASVTNWPNTFPFFIVVDPGTTKEEKMKVSGISSLTVTVVRAQDDTNAVAHNSGAVCYPVFTALEANEANKIASVMTTKGDVITTDGTDINRLAVGTNAHVLQADSTATNGIKWATVTADGIANNAVTTDKINSAAVTAAKLASQVAGSGLVGGAGDALAVNVDDSTIEIQSDTLQIKDSGVTAAKIGVLTNTTAKTDSFTLALADRNTTILCDKSTAMTVTIPTNASVALPVGTQISFVQIGAGQVTFAGDTGVTLNSDTSKKKILVQYGVASLIKTASDTWVLFGQLTA